MSGSVLAERIEAVLALIPLEYCAKIEGDALYVETRATVEALKGQFDAKALAAQVMESLDQAAEEWAAEQEHQASLAR